MKDYEIYKSKLHQFLSYSIASVWAINGVYCKVLNFVPRHQEIVAQILGDEYAFLLIKVIGVAELGMALWVISAKYTKINAVIQISIVAIMNSLEYLLVPELLLWGKANAIFAFLFIIVVYYNEFILGKRKAQAHDS